MTAGAFDAVSMVLVIPAVTAVVLAILPGYWLSARLNYPCNPTDASCRDIAVLRTAAVGIVCSDRRSQHRLHRAHDFGRLHHQRLQRQLHRP